MDPFESMFSRWEVMRGVYRESESRNLIALSRSHEADVRKVLAEMADLPVPYAMVEELTGWALGSLKNNLQNIGTRAEPAFRFGDLPFKIGYASPTKPLMAYNILRQGMDRAA